MKISCQSCQAKYTIADEKVLGKIVKIRCKKCGATIVINGNDPEATAVAHGGAGGGDYAAGGDEQWTVNVAEGDQRTMTVQEIAQEFKTGVVTDETFCWKDGMNDWLPLREIDALYAACSDGGGGGGGGGAQDYAPVSLRHDQHEAAPAYVPPAPNTAPMIGGDVGSSALFGDSRGGHENGNGASAPLFGSGSNPPAAAPSAAAARRTGGRRDHGTDLFGNVAQAGGEDDVMTSAANVPKPSAGGDDGKLTGQRNENSVLFSLNALTTNAPSGGSSGGGGGMGLGSTTAQGDGSGLIDIRALSATMGSDSGPKSSKHVDDIMNLGGGGAFSAALNAPILAPPPADMSSVDYGGGQQQNNNKTLYAIIGGCGLLAVSAIVVALIVMNKKPDDTVSTNPNGTVSMGATPTMTAPTATETVAAVPTTPTAPTNTSGAKAITPGGGGGGGAVAMGGGGPKAGTHATGGGGATTADTPPPPQPDKPKDLLGAMNAAAGEKKSVATAETTSAGSAPFDRGAAAASLGGINVASCKKTDGPTGGGHVKVTFSPSGSVSTVDVDAPPFSGTPVGGCVAGKYRSAHVPAFSGGPVTVGKSFSIN